MVGYAHVVCLLMSGLYCLGAAVYSLCGVVYACLRVGLVSGAWASSASARGASASVASASDVSAIVAWVSGAWASGASASGAWAS